MMRRHSLMGKSWFFKSFVLLVVVFLLAGAANAKQAKYVFLMIGDGMGVAQRTAAELFSKAGQDRQGSLRVGKLAMNSLPVTGMTTTYAYETMVTDSAAAGTALACGQKTTNGVISMDHTGKRQLKTLAEIAAERDMKVGIVSSVSIDHATPACFYAHQASRNSFYESTMALAGSDYEYFAGGTSKATLPGKLKDRKSPFEAAKENGFTIVTTRRKLRGLRRGGGKVWAYNRTTDHKAALHYKIDRTKDYISLAEFTRKGIELLENPDGFFMMVEGGKIDWACHSHDAATAIRDTLDFDDAVAEVLKFYEEHPQDTMIVVTADHETGGMTIGSASTRYAFFPQQLSKQKISATLFSRTVIPRIRKEQMSFEQALPLVQKAFGLRKLSSEELGQLREAYAQSMLDKKDRPEGNESYLLYGGYDPLTTAAVHVLSSRAGVGWTTWSHTGSPVATSAIGVGAESFNGYYDNTDIFAKIVSIMKQAEAPATAKMAR